MKNESDQVWKANLLELDSRIEDAKKEYEWNLSEPEKTEKIVNKLNANGIILADLFILLSFTEYRIYSWFNHNYGTVLMISSCKDQNENLSNNSFYQLFNEVNRTFRPKQECFEKKLAIAYAGKSILKSQKRNSGYFNFKFFLQNLHRIVVRGFDRKDGKGKFYRYYFKKLKNVS